MNPITVHQMTERVSQLLAQRLGAKGQTLQARLDSRARALPRKVRRAARNLAQIEAVVGAPKVIRQANMEEISKDYDICVKHLAPLGTRARLLGLLLSMSASALFALVVTGAAVTGVLVWRGFM